MMMGLAAPVYDPDGAGIIRMTPDAAMVPQGGKRRQTRTPTLDGGASLYDTGYTLSDEQWQIKTLATPGAVALARHLCSNYQKIRATTAQAVVTGTPRSWRMDGQFLILEFLVLGVVS